MRHSHWACIYVRPSPLQSRHRFFCSLTSRSLLQLEKDLDLLFQSFTMFFSVAAVAAAFLLSPLPAAASPVASALAAYHGPSTLNITSLGHQDGVTTLECWQLDNPFQKTSQIGVPGTLQLQLGDVTNMSYTVVPPKFFPPTHNAPIIQYVYCPRTPNSSSPPSNPRFPRSATITREQTRTNHRPPWTDTACSLLASRTSPFPPENTKSTSRVASGRALSLTQTWPLIARTGTPRRIRATRKHFWSRSRSKMGSFRRTRSYMTGPVWRRIRKYKDWRGRRTWIGAVVHSL